MLSLIVGIDHDMFEIGLNQQLCNQASHRLPSQLNQKHLYYLPQPKTNKTETFSAFVSFQHGLSRVL